MCSNYRPVTRIDRLLTFFGVERDREEPPFDVYPDGLAPMIRLRQAGEGEFTDARDRIIEDAVFRFVPGFQTQLAWAATTYNARSETVDLKATFKKAWADGQRCIIPAEHIYEPRYFGTAERPGPAHWWGIGFPGGVPMGVAGVWRLWPHPVTGNLVPSMAMLTVNADGHSVMSKFFKPNEEKRMVIVLDPEDYAEWLSCAPAVAKKFFRRWEGTLDIFDSHRPVREKKVNPRNLDPETGELF